MLRRFSVLTAVVVLFAGGAPAASQPRRPLEADRNFDPRLVAIADLMEAGEYEEAGAQAAELLAVLEAGDPVDSLGVAQLLDFRTEYFMRTGQAQGDEPIAGARRAVEIRNAVHGEGAPGTVSSLRLLGLLEFMRGNLGGARAPLERVLEIRAESGEPPDFTDASVVNNLALITWQLGDLEEAERRFREAILVLSTELGAEHPWVVLARQNRGLVLIDLARYTEAEVELEETVELGARVLGPRHPERARALGGLGFLQWRLGDYASAFVWTEESLAIRNESLGPEHPDTAWNHQLLALLTSQMGDPEAAIVHARRGLEIREAALGPDHVLVAGDCAALASALEKAGRPEEARPWAERRLAILEAQSVAGERRAWAHLDLGMLVLSTADVSGARAHLEQARELWAGPGHPNEAIAREQLAQLDLEAGAFDRAEAELVACLGPAREILGDAHPRVAELELLTAVAARGQGDAHSAREHALEAERIGREHLRLAARGLEERRVRDYAGVRVGGLDLAIELALADPGTPSADTYDAVVRSRSIVFDQLAARQAAHRGIDDPDLEASREELAEARLRLSNLLVRGPSGSESDYREVLEIALARRDRAERDLAQRSAAFRGFEQRQDSGLEAVAGHLSAAETLVSYIAYLPLDGPPAFAAFVLRSGESVPIVVSLGPASAVEEAVEAWREEAARGEFDLSRTRRQSEEAYRAVATRLRRIVWDPLVPHLAGSARVYLVPDGAVHLVNMAALPVDSGGYLVEAGPVLHLLSSERDLVPRVAPVAGQGLLAFGGADYDGAGSPAKSDAAARFRGVPADCATFLGLDFAALPASAHEVEEIASGWSEGGARLRTGVEASEAHFKTEAPGREVLHMATHGFFLGEDCVDPPGSAAAMLRASPLLLSGLALAGANRRGTAPVDAEDGVLTAEEIVSLDLGSVDWAVLSGCDTALGSVDAAEGVLGLRRAFLLAGARSVVMSLWSVDDEATREWMRALYRARVEHGADAAVAVHEASRARLEERRAAGAGTHPFHWAAFVAVGR